MSNTKLEPAFIKTGFSKWVKATAVFKNHESSDCHKQAIQMTVTIPSTIKDVGEQLSTAHAQEKHDNRHCFTKILKCLQYLARQSLPFRGDGKELDSNLVQLIKLQTKDDSKLDMWMDKKFNKFMHHEVQNEILQIMANSIQRKIADNIRAAQFFTIMNDDTTDLSNHEQSVICLRWVADNFEVHEDFIGLYHVESTTADNLVAIIKDVLLRMNLSLKKCRGQCYDGAANMSGKHKGVAKQISNEEIRALFIHCYGHTLSLSVKDAIMWIKCLKDALDICMDIINLIKRSPKRDAALHQIKKNASQEDDDVPTIGIRKMCPTRWTVRADAIDSILSNYNFLQDVWEESLSEPSSDPTLKSRINGISSYMKKFDFFFGVHLAKLLLCHSDNLSKTLQKGDITASEGQELARMVVTTLKSMKNDDQFMSFWNKVLKDAKEKQVDEPTLPRKRQKPARFRDDNTNESSTASNPCDHYKVIFKEAIDAITGSIESRFNQKGYETYKHLEQLVLLAAEGKDFEEELNFVTEFYGSDFNKHSLETQLITFKTTFPRGNNDKVNFKDVVNFMKGLSEAQKEFFSEVSTLVKLILVLPATNAVSERSFSSLRRIKTFLRTTMSQARLNHLMTLNVHKELTDSLSLVDVANQFVSNHEIRMRTFGSFTDND